MCNCNSTFACTYCMWSSGLGIDRQHAWSKCHPIKVTLQWDDCSLCPVDSIRGPKGPLIHRFLKVWIYCESQICYYWVINLFIGSWWHMNGFGGKSDHALMKRHCLNVGRPWLVSHDGVWFLQRTLNIWNIHWEIDTSDTRAIATVFVSKRL